MDVQDDHPAAGLVSCSALTSSVQAVISCEISTATWLSSPSEQDCILQVFYQLCKDHLHA